MQTKPLQLTPDQEAAASAFYGRVSIIAGPGSGKTRVLVERIQRLLAAGVPASEIVAFTFTTRAADELSDRLEDLGERRLGHVGTIHAFCSRLLRMYPAEAGLPTDFTVINEAEQHAILRVVHKQYRIATSLTKCVTAIQECRRLNEGLGQSPVHRDARKLQEGYLAMKAAFGIEDYDGLIDQALVLLMAHPLVLEQIRARWRHWSVDEAQDLDLHQHRLISVLADADSITTLHRESRSALYVGDGMQAIYGFRGGDQSIQMAWHETAHTTAAIVRNHRSAPGIVRVLNALVAHDRVHRGRPELTARPEKPDDVGACLAEIDSHQYEVTAIHSWVQRLLRQGVQAREIAILTRTNQEAWDLAAGTQYELLGKTASRTDNREGHAFVGVIAHALNPANQWALNEALGSDHDIQMRVTEHYVAAGTGLTLRRFLTDLDLVDHPPPWMSPSDALHVRMVLETVTWLRDTVTQGPTACPFGWPWVLSEYLNHRASWQVIQDLDVTILRDLLGRFVSGRIPRRRRVPMTLANFLWWLRHGQDADDYDPAEPRVTVGTIHAAKGLEWDHVWVAGLTDGRLPIRQALRAYEQGDLDAIDEERRLLYVAASRARKTLVLSHPTRNTLDQPVPRSRFLDEINLDGP